MLKEAAGKLILITEQQNPIIIHFYTECLNVQCVSLNKQHFLKHLEIKTSFPGIYSKKHVTINTIGHLFINSFRTSAESVKHAGF